MSPTNSVFLCSSKRTAIGGFNGALAGIPATALGGKVIAAVLEHSGIPKETIHEVIMGCVLTAGTGQAPARQAALAAGLPQNVQALTINKVCSSGLKAVMLAANAVSLGQAEAIIAGGMENMSQAPYLLPALRNGAHLGHATAKDSLIHDALWDVYNDFHMGNAAELCAREYKLTREEQDAYAIESYARASRAIASGHFEAEIVPVEVTIGKTTSDFKIDEEPGRAKMDRIPSLKPAFEKDGTITAANASSINDGAAAVLVCSEQFMRIHKLEPMARLIAQGWSAQAPEWFTTAPVAAMRNALGAAGKSIAEIDLFELNEAFSAVALACGRDLGIDPAKLNVNGGSVALGHPVGASGARILTTLLHTMQRLDVHLGAVAICNGGGEATSVIVERV